MPPTEGEEATMNNAMGPGRILARPAGRHESWRAAAKAPWWRTTSIVLLVLGGTGCSLDGLLNSDQLPKSVSDPAITQTPNGAKAAYIGTLAQFGATFGGFGSICSITGLLLSCQEGTSFVLQSALLSDELQSTAAAKVDQRILPEGEGGASSTYSELQKLRGQAGQAIGLLTRYLADQSALDGHVYALQGYAEIFLAELFCSGIPLSTVDYAGDFTYRPGSTTEQVFTHAIALFDTALTLAGDSTRFVHLARV